MNDVAAKAVAPLVITEAGDYRIWLRHNYHSDRRGPFTLTLSKEGKSLGEKVFDTAGYGEFFGNRQPRFTVLTAVLSRIS